jgi:hypothetical protein
LGQNVSERIGKQKTAAGRRNKSTGKCCRRARAQASDKHQMLGRSRIDAKQIKLDLMGALLKLPMRKSRATPLGRHSNAFM